MQRNQKKKLKLPTEESCILRAKGSRWMIRFHELFNVARSLRVKSICRRISRILNSVLVLTGWCTGMLFPPIVNVEQHFEWIVGSQKKNFWYPDNLQLKESNLEVTKAWKIFSASLKDKSFLVLAVFLKRIQDVTATFLIWKSEHRSDQKWLTALLEAELVLN